MPTNEDYEKIRKKYPARLTRAKAIKLYCKSQCCCDDLDSWKNCSVKSCFLWNFRLGRETLGNQTSFKKHRQNTSNLHKNNISTTNIKPSHSVRPLLSSIEPVELQSGSLPVQDEMQEGKDDN
jgi:hypothetical protein